MPAVSKLKLCHMLQLESLRFLASEPLQRSLTSRSFVDCIHPDLSTLELRHLFALQQCAQVCIRNSFVDPQVKSALQAPSAAHIPPLRPADVQPEAQEDEKEVDNTEGEWNERGGKADGAPEDKIKEADEARSHTAKSQARKVRKDQATGRQVASRQPKSQRLRRRNNTNNVTKKQRSSTQRSALSEQQRSG